MAAGEGPIRWADTTMKVLRTPILIALLALLDLACAATESARSKSSPLPALPLVRGESYLGLIIPEEMFSMPEEAGGISLETRNFFAETWAARVKESWTPTSEIVASLETDLRAGLERGLEDPTVLEPSITGYRCPDHLDWILSSLRFVLEKLPEYRRQYFGIITPDGSRRVLVSFFLESPLGDASPLSKWRLGPVLQFGGGASAWRIQHDVRKREYLHYDVNH